MVDISEAEKIPGWMAKEELIWLAERAQENSAIVEVGSFMGRSTRAICDHAKGTVFSVDTWQGCPEIRSTFTEAGGPAADFATYKHFQSEHLDVRLFPMLASSAAAASTFPVAMFDMVFIDADHAMHAVITDICMWGRLIKEGGLICGHDYNNYKGVNFAVDSLIPTRRLVEGTSIWWANVHAGDPELREDK